MCTVVVRVPEPGAGPVRLLAVRDEDPGRPWRPLGHWWREHPTMRGIQDQQAGGAWLATLGGRAAVLLNRDGGSTSPQPTSRGTLVTATVTGQPLPSPLTTLGFNLVDATLDRVRVTSWTGGHPRIEPLSPGTHMIAHDDVDDARTPRIQAWLGRFAEATTESGPWWLDWMDVLRDSARLAPTDDRAIVRDNRPQRPTLTLLVCAVSVYADRTEAAMATLDRPGRWNPLSLSS